MSDLAFKRGSTLSLAGVCKLPQGTWSATSKIKLISGTKVSLGVALAALQASIALSKAAADTASWAVGTARIDIVFTDTAGNSVPTETFELVIEETIT
ncbi:MAG: hypothetical protein EBS54_03390 [Betaproteobacteria bacterium]|nr:hypothetical protein [Betaproteobacteria bacterium]